jgi:hypothetical protein
MGITARAKKVTTENSGTVGLGPILLLVAKSIVCISLQSLSASTKLEFVQIGLEFAKT